MSEPDLTKRFIDASAIKPRAVHAYLCARGWAFSALVGGACAHFVRDGQTLEIPNRPDFDDYPLRIREAIDDIAIVENVPTAEVREALLSNADKHWADKRAEETENRDGPYNGRPFGWAFRTGAGCWRWSMGTTGLARDDAAERARQNARDEDEPAQIARVWIDVPPGDSPIDALAIIERAEEMYRDNRPEVILPNDSEPIIRCETAEVADLQRRLDAAWGEWLKEQTFDAAFVADDEAEDV